MNEVARTALVDALPVVAGVSFALGIVAAVCFSVGVDLVTSVRRALKARAARKAVEVA